MATIIVSFAQSKAVSGNNKYLQKQIQGLYQDNSWKQERIQDHSEKGQIRQAKSFSLSDSSETLEKARLIPIH